jgi:hypothetical protein
LVPFRSLLDFPFLALHLGFKYLGFYLKTGPQRVADWLWLIKKLKKRLGTGVISGFRWEEGLLLLKTVLESQSIYWMAVELIPKFIINQIRKLCFNFLWNGNNTTSHIPFMQLGGFIEAKIKWGMGSQEFGSF